MGLEGEGIAPAPSAGRVRAGEIRRCPASRGFSPHCLAQRLTPGRGCGAGGQLATLHLIAHFPGWRIGSHAEALTERAGQAYVESQTEEEEALVNPPEAPPGPALQQLSYGSPVAWGMGRSEDPVVRSLKWEERSCSGWAAGPRPARLRWWTVPSGSDQPRRGHPGLCPSGPLASRSGESGTLGRGRCYLCSNQGFTDRLAAGPHGPQTVGPSRDPASRPSPVENGAERDAPSPKTGLEARRPPNQHRVKIGRSPRTGADNPPPNRDDPAAGHGLTIPFTRAIMGR